MILKGNKIISSQHIQEIIGLIIPIWHHPSLRKEWKKIFHLPQYFFIFFLLSDLCFQAKLNDYNYCGNSITIRGSTCGSHECERSPLRGQQLNFKPEQEQEMYFQVRKQLMAKRMRNTNFRVTLGEVWQKSSTTSSTYSSSPLL